MRYGTIFNHRHRRNGIEGIAACMGGFIDPVTGKNTDFSVGENFRTYNLKVELEKYSNRHGRINGGT